MQDPILILFLIFLILNWNYIIIPSLAKVKGTHILPECKILNHILEINFNVGERGHFKGWSESKCPALWALLFANEWPKLEWVWPGYGEKYLGFCP